MGTSGVHKFHFTSDSAKASHVAWEHLDYDHTTNAFLLDCAFTNYGKHPQVVELPLPHVTGCTEFYNPTRPSYLVGGALVRCHRSYFPTEIRSMQNIGLEQIPCTFLEELNLLLEHLVGLVYTVELDPCPNQDP